MSIYTTITVKKETLKLARDLSIKTNKPAMEIVNIALLNLIYPKQNYWGELEEQLAGLYIKLNSSQKKIKIKDLEVKDAYPSRSWPKSTK